MAGAGDKAKRGLRVLRRFLGGLKVTYQDITIGLDIKASTTVPAGAGQNYSFAGPTLVIALATDNFDD
jgi:hypothetical protein